jgi:hypothetical protein
MPGFRVGCLNGNRPGIDHTYNGRIVYPLGGAGGMNIRVPFTTAMRWLWLVQEWTLDMTITHPGSFVPTPITDTFHFVVTKQANRWHAADYDSMDQEYLVANQSWFEDRRQPDLSFGVPGAILDCFFLGDNGSSAPDARVVLQTAFIDYQSPDKTFGFVLGLEFFFSGMSSSTLVGLGSAHLVGNIEMDGITLPLTLTFDSFHGIGGDLPGTTASGTLTPTKFYAYSTKSGLPVYDTATGDLLNDPFS